MALHRRSSIIALAVALLATAPVAAQEPRTWAGIQAPMDPTGAQSMDRMDVWDLRLGTAAADISDGFVEYACGTNGGPPSLPLEGFEGFHRCEPEPSDLYEVYFRYDDELEYRARATGDAARAERFAGTRVLIHPVILSGLFSEAGTLEGIRVVTDPRAEVAVRQSAYLLGPHLMGRFGEDGWTCTELPRGERESAINGIFIKQRCEKRQDDVRLTMENHFLQKPGQTTFDPHTNQLQPGNFESLTRFEMYRAAAPTAG